MITITEATVFITATTLCDPWDASPPTLENLGIKCNLVPPNFSAVVVPGLGPITLRRLNALHPELQIEYYTVYTIYDEARSAIRPVGLLLPFSFIQLCLLRE